MITEIAYKILINCILISIAQIGLYSMFNFERQPAVSSQKPVADKWRNAS